MARHLGRWLLGGANASHSALLSVHPSAHPGPHLRAGHPTGSAYDTLRRVRFLRDSGQTRALQDFVLHGVRRGDRSEADVRPPSGGDAHRRLLEIAELHGVVPMVRERLGTMRGGSQTATGDIDPTTALAAATHLRALGDLARIGEALGASGVRWLVIKGPASSELLWEKPEHREYTDLDILVSPGSFATALDALTDAGFELLERNWDLLLDRRRGQVHLRAPHVTLVDLHWDLIAEGDLRDEFRIDTEAIIGRSTEERIGATPVWVLEPIDRLLHLALHACLSGGHRLIWLKDIEAACTASPVNWEAVVERAHAMSIGPLVGLILRRTNAVLDATLVPSAVIRALESNRSWRWVTRLADAATSPVPLKDGSFRKLIARATRPTARASWVALFRSVASQTSTRMGPAASTDLRDPTHPGSMLFESGGEPGRDAYVRWVTESYDPPATRRHG